MRPQPITDALIAAISAAGEISTRGVEAACPQVKRESVGPMLHWLFKKGRVVKAGRGKWAISLHSDEVEPA